MKFLEEKTLLLVCCKKCTKKYMFPVAIFPEYVSKHWKEDDFFGYQFLNGTNPNAIKRCSKLPPNFPVTEEMVKPCLPNGLTLKDEMEV